MYRNTQFALSRQRDDVIVLGRLLPAAPLMHIDIEDILEACRHDRDFVLQDLERITGNDDATGTLPKPLRLNRFPE